MNQQSQYDLWQAEQHRNELQVSKLLVAWYSFSRIDWGLRSSRLELWTAKNIPNESIRKF
jgi:hypothetical protein